MDLQELRPEISAIQLYFQVTDVLRLKKKSLCQAIWVSIRENPVC